MSSPKCKNCKHYCKGRCWYTVNYPPVVHPSYHCFNWQRDTNNQTFTKDASTTTATDEANHG